MCSFMRQNRQDWGRRQLDARHWLQCSVLESARARRCRLEPFRKLASTLKERFEAVVRRMVDHHSNVLVEAINGLMQQAKRAARGFRASRNLVGFPDGQNAGIVSNLGALTNKHQPGQLNAAPSSMALL